MEDIVTRDVAAGVDPVILKIIHCGSQELI